MLYISGRSIARSAVTATSSSAIKSQVVERTTLFKLTKAMTHVDKGTRLGNFIIDVLIISTCYIILTLIIYNFYPEILDGNSSALNIVLWATTFCYYFFFELLLGRTIGKMITNTAVVDRCGNKPNPLRLLIRTLARLIPFDGLTYLFGSVGLHDLLSRTTVIKRTKPV